MQRQHVSSISRSLVKHSIYFQKKISFNSLKFAHSLDHVVLGGDLERQYLQINQNAGLSPVQKAAFDDKDHSFFQPPTIEEPGGVLGTGDRAVSSADGDLLQLTVREGEGC